MEQVTITTSVNVKDGPLVKVNAKVESDAYVVASLALQHGVAVDTIRKALLRDPRGVASSPLGVALDLISERDR